MFRPRILKEYTNQVIMYGQHLRDDDSFLLPPHFVEVYKDMIIETQSLSDLKDHETHGTYIPHQNLIIRF